jgi:cysteine-rich repeat protein
MRTLTTLLLFSLSACSLRIPSKPTCGDGEVHLGEDCDDGNNQGGDGCEADCSFTGAVCGNGTLEGNEDCDDGNNQSGDGCSSLCLVELASCSNGIVDPGEVCFDANPLTLTGVTQPRGIDIADLNQDSKPDIIVSEQGFPDANGVFGDGINDEVLVFLQSNNTFSAPTGIVVGDASRFVRAQDISGDGNPEILVTHQGSDTFSQLNNQGGVLIFASSISVPNPAEFVLGDLDGDQILDIAIASLVNTVEIILSSQQLPISLKANCGVEGVDLGDFDKDGSLDVLSVCGQNTAANQVKLFSGADILLEGNAAVPFITLSVPETRVGRFGDFDADGLLDIVVVERTNNQAVFFFQQVNGAFDSVGVDVGVGIISMTIADMNRDSVPDVVTAEETDDQSTIVISNRDRTFTTLALPVGIGPRVVAVGDLNQDTLPDVATANRNDDSITVYLSTP